jgi:hypothetical protein
VKKVWKTKRDKVWKLTYSWDDSKVGELLATGDHLVMLRDGSYKELRMLKKGDSLMSFQNGNYKAAEKLEILNHVVLDVQELDKRMDVYDMEVEDHHNFVTGDGLVLHNSTRKYDHGTFQRLLSEADEKQMKIYCWCVWEVLEKCTRECKNDSEYGNCPVWDKCKGMAHHCSGFYKIGDFIEKSMMLSKDIWESQWLNKRPSQEALVYGGYWDRDVHYLPIGAEPDANDNIIIMSSIDFGSSPGHPFVYQKCWVDYNDFFRAIEELEPGKDVNFRLLFWLFYEYRASSGTMAQHSTKIKNSPEYMPGEIIFADPSAKQARIDMAELYNIETYNAINAVEEGIDLTRNHLETYYDYSEGGKKKSWLYVVDGYLDSTDNLIGTDLEFERYRYPKGLDGKPVRRSPLQVDDHGMDCIRYTIMTAYKMIPQIAMPPSEVVNQGGFWFDDSKEI